MLRALLLRASPPMRPNTSLAPQKAISQNHAQKFPISISVLFWSLSLPCKQVSILSGRCTVRLRAAIFSQHSSLSGSGVHCSQASCSSSAHVLCYTGSQWGPGRHVSPESGFSIRPSEKQQQLLSHSTPCGFSSWWTFSPTPFQTTWLLLLPLLVCHYFKCSARNFLYDFISSPSYDLSFLPVPPVSFTSFRLSCLVRARVPCTSGGGGHLPPASCTGVM